MLAMYLVYAGLLIQTGSRPLPDAKQFVSEFRATLHTDDVLLSQYTYTEKRTHIELASDDKAKTTETDIYQVTRGSDGAIYRRLVSKNGEAVQSAKVERVNRTGRSDQQIMDDVF